MRAPVRVSVGGHVAPASVGPITATDIVRFAGAGGDFNPLHHDPEFAAAAGYPGVIAMGQLQAGMLAGWLADWCGVEHLRELEVRFVAPVRPGDTLTFAGEVNGVDPAERLANLTLTASVEGKPVVQATAIVHVAD
ncbi:MaoC family dehydratase [Labedaea rhizosphaerae]|uniref:Acyl dehydratase n=1 Tax=Labedaea rhizosphaerae TaxID=598644 RepID=A0A4R6RY71_LABRH|nr:MaoC family dehydratase [Labedaea rhizosphaerae]TDP91883.1 acyl dehydratase [Labedaea rhizosphaerae]